MKRLCVMMIAVAAFSYAQNDIVEARPEIGWDSLRTLFVYPEIARRAGIEDVGRVSVELDSLGNVTSVEFVGYGIFSPAVKSTVKSVRWIPESYRGKKRSSQIIFDVQFQLQDGKNFPKRRVLTIEATNPDVRKK